MLLSGHKMNLMALRNCLPGTFLAVRLCQRQSGIPLPLAPCSWNSSGLMLLNDVCGLVIVRELSIPFPRFFKSRSPGLSESADRPPRYVGADCAPWRWSSCKVTGWPPWIGGTTDRESTSAHTGVAKRTTPSTGTDIPRSICLVTMMASPFRFWILSWGHDNNESVYEK